MLRICLIVSLTAKSTKEDTFYFIYIDKGKPVLLACLGCLIIFV